MIAPTGNQLVASPVLRSWLILAILVGSIASKAQPPKAELPFVLKENLILIKVQVNGSRELNFLFDTGAGVTVLNSSTAKTLQLKIGGESVIGTSGNSVKALTAIDNVITMGEVQIPGIDLEVFSIDHLSEYLKMPLDGIIGFDLLRNFITQVDIDNQVILLYNHDKELRLDDSWKTVEIIPARNNRFAIVASFLTNDNKYINLPLMVDSGYGSDMALFPNATRRNLAFKRRTRQVQGMSADSTITTNKGLRVKSMALADERFKNLWTVVMIDPVSVKAFSKEETFGLLGQGILLSFEIIYDLPNETAYFRDRK